MTQRPFGGAHTQAKLDKLEAYLDRYTTALKNQPFHRVYFDAFAGTGDIPLPNDGPPLFEGDEFPAFIRGSADRALRISNSFHEYVFVESSKQKVVRLNDLRSRHADLGDRINIICGDANAELVRFCEERDWRRSRAVVFLDPFGNQVDWDTIVAIAQTEAIDLWYLFPAGLGVHRQIGRDGTVHYTHEDSLDRIFGTPDWRSAFIEEKSTPNLFMEEHRIKEKSATPDSITQFMIMRMKKVFRGGVLDDWLPLGSRGIREVDPVWWTPEHWDFRSPRWRRSKVRMRRNFAGR